MLFLTRKENQGIYIDGKKLKVLEIQPARIKYSFGDDVHVCRPHARQYFGRGYIIFKKDRFPNQVRVGIQANPGVIILREELKARARRGQS